MSAKSKYGPSFVRRAFLQLSAISTDHDCTGWRPGCPDRVKELTTSFSLGEFGLTVTCGVQVLEKEAPDNSKLIDDGVSTVSALKECHAAHQACQDRTPEGHDWPSNLLEIFQHGLEVRVVAYEDDDDRDAREAWNIAKHDEESNSVRWSSVYQKISVATKSYKKLGDWAAVTKDLHAKYGPGKKSTVSRWIRAAKGLHPEVALELEKHPTLKGTAIWDNPHLVHSAHTARNMISPRLATKAIEVFKEKSEVGSVSADYFTNEICKPMKILEVWHSLIEKRFGSVAKNSRALGRLLEHLSSVSGLQTVLRCAQSGVNLHGKSAESQGIPECYMLVKELEKCHAGGLPPPMKIPSEAEFRQEQELEKKAAEEAQQAAAKVAQQAAADAADETKRLQTEELAGEADIYSLVGPETVASTPGPEELAKARVADVIKGVHFCETPQALLSEADFALKSESRIVVLLEAPTTTVSGISHLFDVAKEVWDRYQQGAGAGASGQTRFRLVVLFGSRWDLLTKAMERAKVLWPQWATMVAQIQRRAWQTSRDRPTYALVICPIVEASAREPTVVQIPFSKNAIKNQGCGLRCTEVTCPWRQSDVGNASDDKREIDGEDKVDLLATMLQDIDELGEEEKPQLPPKPTASLRRLPARLRKATSCFGHTRTPTHITMSCSLHLGVQTRQALL